MLFFCLFITSYSDNSSANFYIQKNIFCNRRPYNSDDDDEDPDEPDESDDSDNGADHSSSAESEDENAIQVGTFHNVALNVNVQLLGNLTKGEVVALQLANAVRHKMTFESVIDHFKNLNALFGPHFFPESKTKLWDIILINKTGIQFHVYCGRRECGRYIERRDRIVGLARCRCGYNISIEKARFFVTLDIKTQIIFSAFQEFGICYSIQPTGKKRVQLPLKIS